MATSIPAKVQLLQAILTDLNKRFNIPGLRWVGFSQRGGAQIWALTGEVRIEKKFLDNLSAPALKMVAAHEAGHARSKRARRMQTLLLAESWQLGLFMSALALMLADLPLASGVLGCSALLRGLDLWSQQGQDWEEEVRADAFSAYYCGGLPAWTAAMQDALNHTAPARQAALRIRQRALQELDQRGLLEAVALHPGRPFPRLQALRGLR